MRHYPSFPRNDTEGDGGEHGITRLSAITAAKAGTSTTMAAAKAVTTESDLNPQWNPDSMVDPRSVSAATAIAVYDHADGSTTALVTSGRPHDSTSHCSSNHSCMRIQALKAREEALQAQRNTREIEHHIEVLKMQKLLEDKRHEEAKKRNRADFLEEEAMRSVSGEFHAAIAA